QNLLGTIENTDDRVLLLQRLVDGYLELRLTIKALNIATQISEPAERAYTLCKVARNFWDEGEGEKAERVLLDIRTCLPQTESCDRADLLDDIAQLLVHM